MGFGVLAEHLRIAWQALRSNMLRTLLTALSVSLGAGAISLMVSLTKSGVATMTSGMDAVGGRHLVFVVPTPPKKAKLKTYDKGINSSDAQAIRDRVPGLESVAFMTTVKRQTITANGKKSEVDVGVGSQFRRFLNQPIKYGQDIPDDAEKSTARVAVISFKIAQELFQKPEDGVGQTLIIWGHRYDIVGVTAEASTMGFRMGGVDKERTIFVSTAVMVKDEGVLDTGFMILTDNGRYSHDYIIRVADAILIARHGGTDDFEFIDFAQMMSKFDKIFTALRVMTGLIAAVSLLIAGAGIMNVLLASIKQRVREIGMRRAIGASEADIRTQFITEAVVLAGVGGVFGSLAGLLGAWGSGFIAGKFVPGWEPRISWEAAVLAIFVAALSGFVFGLQPARRAARLEVVACLRGDS